MAFALVAFGLPTVALNLGVSNASASLACRAGMPLTLNGAGAGTVTGSTTNYENEQVNVVWRNPTMFGVMSHNWSSPTWSPSFTGDMARFNTMTGDLLLELSRPVKNAFINFYSIGQPSMPFNLTFFDHSSGMSSTPAPIRVAGQPGGLSNQTGNGFRAAEGNVSVHFPGTYSAIRVNFVQPNGQQESWMGVTFGLCLGEDFGDLPDTGSGSSAGNYRTLMSDSGPSHGDRGAFIGAAAGPETEAKQNATATGDDSDEIAPTSINVDDTSYSLDVPVTYAAPRNYCLAGFLDANGDGDFADTGEIAPVASGINASGTRTLNWSGFTGPTDVTQKIGVRVRLASTEDNAGFCASPQPTGLLMDGEVEDALATVTAESDLAIAKTLVTPASGPINPGAPVSYRLVVTNNGSARVVNPGAVVTDTVPAGLTGTWACGSPTGGAVCPSVGSGSNLSSTILTMPAGASLTYTFTGTASPTMAQSPVTNTATVTAPNTMTETNSANNTSSVTTNVVAVADVTQTKTLVTNPVKAGEPVVWNVTVRNNGPSPANGVRVVDVLGAGLTFRPYSAAATATTSSTECTAVGQTVTCPVTGSMASGATQVFRIAADLRADATGTVSNTSKLVNPTGPSCTADPPTDPACSSDVGPDPIAVESNVTQVKSIVTNPVVPGAPVVYRVVTTNAGPAVARNVKVTDNLQTGLTFRPHVTGDGTTSSEECTAVGQNVTCPLGTIAVGASVTTFIAAMLDPASTTPISNTSRLVNPQGPDCMADPSTDPACSSTVGPSNVTPQADVRQTKSIVTNPVVAGAPVVYRIVVRNDGPSLARNVSVVDTLDSRLTFRPNVTGDATTSSAGCTASAQVVTCPVGDLAPGATRTVTIAGTLDPTATGTVANTARTINPTGPRCVSPSDPDPACTSSAGPDTITQNADVRQTKTLVTDPVVAGRPVVWRIRVVNNGPSAARGVKALDTLGAGLTFRPHAAGDNTTSSAACTAAGQNVTCLVGDMAPGATVDLFVAALLDANAQGTVSNTSRLVNPTGPSCTADPPTDPACSSTAGPDPVTEQANVTHTKTLVGSVVAGRTVTYRFVVTNTGPSTARGVRFTDVLDPRLTFTPFAAGNADSSSQGCTAAGQTVTCTAGTVLVGSPQTFFIRAVLASNATGAVSNTSRLINPTGPNCTADPSTDPACASSTGPDQIGLEANVTHRKAVETSPIVAGRPVVWTVTVTNDGPSTATNVRVVDTLAAGLTFRPHVAGDSTTSSPECSAAGQTVTCTIASLPVSTVVLRIAAMVDPDVTTPIANTANLINPTGPTCRTAGECNSSTGPDAVTTIADPTLTVDVPETEIDVNGTTPRTWTVSNNGPSTSRDTVLTITLPGAITTSSLDVLTLEDGRVTTLAAPCTGRGTVSCNLGSVRPGARVTIPNTVTGIRLGRHTARGVVSSGTTDSNGANNNAQTDVLVGATISGRAWADNDGSSTYNGEPAAPVANALLRAPDGTLSPLSFAADGSWSKRIYVDGDWAVAYPAAPGYRPAALNASGNAGIDAQTGFTTWMSVYSPGVSPRAVNAGYAPIGDLLIMGYLDLNGNDRWDFEPLIPNVGATADHLGNQTLAAGMVRHNGILSRDYSVRVVDPSNRDRTGPGTKAVRVPPGGLALALFGFLPRFDLAVNMQLTGLNGKPWSPTFNDARGRVRPNVTRSGDAVTWTVTVTNNGPDISASTNSVIIPIPQWLRYRHHNAFWFGPCRTVGDNFICTTGALQPGQTVTFEFCHVIFGNPMADAYTITANLMSFGQNRVIPDTNPANNVSAHTAPFFTWRNKKVVVPQQWRKYTPVYSTRNGCRC